MVFSLAFGKQEGLMTERELIEQEVKKLLSFAEKALNKHQRDPESD